jgi:RNA-binding protein 26
MMVDGGVEQNPGPFPSATFGNTFPPIPNITSHNGMMGTAPPTSGRNTQPGPRGTAKGDKTLVIEKIPSDQLRLEAINDWFKKFGTVTNVAVDTKGAKALISFSQHDDAVRAWKSQDAVFGNRFVKVYWHRPMEGQGGAGKRALEASASALQANGLDVLAKTAEPSKIATVQSIAKTEPANAVKPKSVPTTDASSKAEALEKNIAEQKALFARLKTAHGDEKKDILAQIRILSDNMPQLSTPGSGIASAQTSIDGDQSSKLLRLDKELDLQQAVQELTRRAQDPNEDHEAIRAELTVLMEKVRGIRSTRASY